MCIYGQFYLPENQLIPCNTVVYQKSWVTLNQYFDNYLPTHTNIASAYRVIHLSVKDADRLQPCHTQINVSLPPLPNPWDCSNIFGLQTIISQVKLAKVHYLQTCTHQL